MVISEAFRAEWAPRLLSVLRIVVALLFLQHGLTKLVGFPGTAPANFNWFTLAPGLASLIETFGGLALLFGFYTGWRRSSCPARWRWRILWRTSRATSSPTTTAAMRRCCIASCSSILPWSAVGSGAWTRSLPGLNTGRSCAL